MIRSLIVAFIAAGEIAAKRAVTVAQNNGADYCAKVANIGDLVIGVSGIKTVADGKTADITLAGIVPVVAGEDITAGDAVKVGANGVAMVGETGDLCFGIAHTNASEGADVFVLLTSIRR